MRAFSLLAPVLLLSALAACEETPPPPPPAETGQDIVDACAATGCTILNLDGRSLDNYGQLAALAQVQSVMLSYTDFADLGPLAAMGGLRELHVGSSNVTDLGGLAAFPGLTVLHVQDLDVRDYRPIRQLRSLQELAIGQTGLPSVDFVQDLPDLRRLSLANARINDLRGLSGHPRLEEIDLTGIYGVTGEEAFAPDLSPLLTLPNLRRVSLDESTDPAQETLVAALRAMGVDVVVLPFLVVC